MLEGAFTINHPPRHPPRDPRAMREAADAGKDYVVGTSGNMRLIRSSEELDLCDVSDASSGDSNEKPRM